ncbi:MAG TPA: hypothetical protein V6D06_18955 [Trichocoleus sp.]
MLPTILHKDRIHPFNFYHQNAIYQGVTVAGHLYQHLSSFSAPQRLQAFEKACELSVQGTVLLTVDQAGQYDLWADVRLTDLKPQPVMRLALGLTETQLPV